MEITNRSGAGAGEVKRPSQPTFTCSNLIIETAEQGVKCGSIVNFQHVAAD